jgi:hypothetical protein
MVAKMADKNKVSEFFENEFATGNIKPVLDYSYLYWQGLFLSRRWFVSVQRRILHSRKKWMMAVSIKWRTSSANMQPSPAMPVSRCIGKPHEELGRDAETGVMCTGDDAAAPRYPWETSKVAWKAFRYNY